MSLFLASLAALTFHDPVSHAVAAESRTDVGHGLYTIMGSGGNILFSTGKDGTFVIDDQFAKNADENMHIIKDVSDTAIVFVLNTHYHGDHAGGNEYFAKAGATILAQDNVRKRLEAEVATGKLDASSLPTITFSDTTTFYWNDKEVHIFHHPNAHTDGDALVHFRKANVIHMGDTMFSGLYPYIDIDSGGSVAGMIGALQAGHDLADSATTIIPGHGPISKKSDIAASIAMLNDTRALVRAEMMKGLSKDDVIAASPIKSYDEDFDWAFINGARMTGQLFEDLMKSDPEAKAAVENGPAAAPAQSTEVVQAPAVIAPLNATQNPSQNVALPTPASTPVSAPSIADQLNNAQTDAIEASEEAGSAAAELIKDLTTQGSDE